MNLKTNPKHMNDISVSIAAKLEDQNIYIMQSPDNDQWTDILIQDTNVGHFDADRRPKHFTTFETKELHKVIKALLLYSDAVISDR
jgi:hypothetical protein